MYPPAPLRRPESISYSFASSEATETTTDSGSTLSTSSTIWGPGALAGKFLYAFGEKTLRGIEKAIILRKLQTIRSHISSSKLSLRMKDTVYDDLLELSRRDLYSSSIRRHAMGILLYQIAARETSYIVTALSKWPSVEISLFLSEIIKCLPPAWSGLHNSRRQAIHRKLETAHISSQLQAEPLKFDSLVKFFVQIATSIRSGCEVIAEAGFIYMMTCIRLDDFEIYPSPNDLSQLLLCTIDCLTELPAGSTLGGLSPPVVDVRRQVLEMVLVHISTNQTSILVKALALMPAANLSLLLSEVIKCLPTPWSGLDDSVRQAVHRELENTYISPRSSAAQLGIGHLAQAFVQVAATGPRGCEVIVETGLLNIMSHIRLDDLETHLSPNDLSQLLSILGILTEPPEISMSGGLSTLFVNIRQQVLEMVLVKISTGRTSMLVKALALMSAANLSLLLSEVIKCLPTPWSGLDDSVRQAVHRELENICFSSQSSMARLGIGHLAQIFVQVATTGPRGCEVIVETGLFNIMERIRLETLSPNDLSQLLSILYSPAKLPEISMSGGLSDPFVGIRRQVLEMVLVQISTSRTLILVEALALMPSANLSSLLSEVIKCLPTSWSGLKDTTRRAIHKELEMAVFPPHSSRSPPVLVSFLQTFTQIAATGPCGCEATVKAGFLDVLEYIYLNDSETSPFPDKAAEIILHKLSPSVCALREIHNSSFQISVKACQYGINLAEDAISICQDIVGRVYIHCEALSMDEMRKAAEKSYTNALDMFESFRSVRRKVVEIMNPETRLILLRLGNAEELQGSQRWYEQGTAIASTVSQAMDANNFAEADTRLRVVHVEQSCTQEIQARLTYSQLLKQLTCISSDLDDLGLVELTNGFAQWWCIVATYLYSLKCLIAHCQTRFNTNQVKYIWRRWSAVREHHHVYSREVAKLAKLQRLLAPSP